MYLIYPAGLSTYSSRKKYSEISSQSEIVCVCMLLQLKFQQIHLYEVMNDIFNNNGKSIYGLTQRIE